MVSGLLWVDLANLTDRLLRLGMDLKFITSRSQPHDVVVIEVSVIIDWPLG